MATTFRVHLPTSGLTVRAQLFRDDLNASSTIINLTEGGGIRVGVYVGDMTGQPAGRYGIRFYDSAIVNPTNLLGSGTLEWDGTNIIERASRATQVSVDALETANAARAVADVAEHDATQAALAALPVPATPAQLAATEAVLVAEHDATQAAIAALPVPASAADITAQTVALTAEHDATQAAIAALPAPALPTDIAAAQAAIIAEIDANQADLASLQASLVAITNFVDTLEAGQVTIQGFVDQLESGQGDMTVLLNDIAGYTDTIEATLATLPTAAGIASETLNFIVEGTTTVRQSLALANAANAGVTENMGTATGLIKALDGVTDRITATLDQKGNRTAIATNFADITI